MNTHGNRCSIEIWGLRCTILEMAPTKHPWSQYEGVAAISNVGNNKDISRIILLLRQTTFWDVHPPHPLCIYSFLCVLSASNLFWILKGSCLSNACRASRHFVCFGSKKILLFIYDVHVYRTGGNTRPPDTQFSKYFVRCILFLPISHILRPT